MSDEQVDVAIVGAGPAGLTAALLLARAGRKVTVFEADDQIGGLWASRLDADGFFRGDNSCKVYQAGYHTAPALFELLGTRWQDHFTQRHDLTTHWLKPFIADCSARDLAILGGAYVLHRLRRGRFHEVSVAEFLDDWGLSEGCKAWMRATALGGIAGTLRMTMWEFFHRLGSNVTEILRGADGPLFWNAQPPNKPGGFVARWVEALEELGVTLATGTPVTSLHARAGRRTRLVLADRAVDAGAVFLAIPPPALAQLLDASDDALAGGFGKPRHELPRYLERSLYAHVGISWFFDRPLTNPLPLGGHNVRQGWHPILVQHDQYGEHLRDPSVAVVVGSIAIDTDFRHHRLGTLASEHSLEELAQILWDDERRVDPTLPEAVDVEIMGNSSATQIVRAGPLPVAMGGRDVYLATNLHGRAPYFTASLESAIQAGAIAAQTFDPTVERLPMGPKADVRLPWDTPHEADPAPSRPARAPAHAST